MKISRISLAFKALREIGPRKLGLFALYQMGKQIGYFRWTMKAGKWETNASQGLSPVLHPVLDLPDPETLREIIGLEGLSRLKNEANEIVDGHVRLFGSKPVALNLTPPGELSHWTKTRNRIDVKFIWEPARFGWTFILGRAYLLTGDERYPAAFWDYFDDFQKANPVNLGPNWESAQEVALRLIAFAFAAQIFADSVHSTVERRSQAALSIVEHATRIPPTLIYARAQNNNHLLSEAAGLITASLALPEDPEAERWSKLGWKWFNHGLESQITEEGSYAQHSTNYHRLMLQLALWIFHLQNAECNQLTLPLNEHISKRAKENLQLATQWLLDLLDRETGHVPNLGPNDGAYILPFTSLPFSDYHSTLQAAACSFLGEAVFEPGIWDEMAAWLGTSGKTQVGHSLVKNRMSTILRTSRSWAYLRAAKFNDRPGHADQLHLDLWWRGFNIAQDAGTYLYNADPPWDNALTHTAVHNTVLVDGREQMTRAGRFLYLDRVQAELLQPEKAQDASWERITARHDGYLAQGILHIRSVTAYQEVRWVVEDLLQPAEDQTRLTACNLRLHWLLPDWRYEIWNAKSGIRIESPWGWVDLAVSVPSSSTRIQLVRAGELLHGNGEISPTWGWVSPTYGVKKPALSFAVIVEGELPISLVSEWRFPNE